jgi:hypothetical protein
MKTNTAICIEDWELTAPVKGEDRTDTLRLERGKEYIISPPRDGTVMVFTRYWVRAPERIFAGAKEFT